MRLQSLFAAIVFLCAAIVPCFSGSSSLQTGSIECKNREHMASNHHMVEAEARSHRNSHDDPVSQGWAALAARCPCGCNDGPPAAGSLLRLGFALIRPLAEPINTVPVIPSEIESTHAIRLLYPLIDHVPISS
jgi:hypothetical protein